jgi:polysaccharide biosynthesis protein PslG
VLKRFLTVVLAAVALAAGCVWWFSDGGHRTVASATLPTAHCGGDIGIAPAWMLNASDADLNRDMEATRDLGAAYFRFDVDWSLVEPEKGVYNWAPIDRMVNAVVNQGMRPLGVLAYTPAWAQPAGAVDSSRAPANHFAPANPADFAGFATQAATRYAGSITDWEIWNEPNRASFWSPAPDAAAYTRLLVEASNAIRAVQPDANVIAGALAPGENHADGEIDPITFAERIYDNGGREAFDTLSVHPYTYPWMPDDPSTASWSSFQKIPRIHDLMAARGDGEKPIWITEFGAPTGSDSTSVSEDTQAAYITAGITEARKLGYIPVILIYAIRDSGTEPGDPEQNFGLLRRDFEPKPAYAAVRELAAPSLC